VGNYKRVNYYFTIVFGGIQGGKVEKFRIAPQRRKGRREKDKAKDKGTRLKDKQKREMPKNKMCCFLRYKIFAYFAVRNEIASSFSLLAMTDKKRTVASFLE